MKRSLPVAATLIAVCCFITTSIAQNTPGDDILRSLAEPGLRPFYHGVASGDPTASSVIIWTRVTPEVDDAVTVYWKVSTDTTFSDTVRHGSLVTSAAQDYTVKIDVDGLQPATWYYYEFTAMGRNSVIGRTRTAPAGAADQLRFAVVSCSSYETGYFNVYRRLFDNNDVDAVLHLGDYIYEYGSSGILAGPRAHVPEYEIIELADYRMRHAQHKLDPDSRKMHQNFPLIATWDDHESANNSWRDGAQNHTEGSEGSWTDRKNASMQAYYEWMPIRLPDEENFPRIFRKISYGNLADIFVLDTRLYGRDEQSEFPGQYSSEDRTILGDEQMEWLKAEMLASDAQWKIIAQQVMFGQLVIPNYFYETFTPLNGDQWDGYSADRTELYDLWVENEIDNVVVLTGDIHTHWAMDLPYNIFDYNRFTGEGSIAVEFVCNAVTSTSSPVPLPPVYDLIRAFLPYIKYIDLSRKGYTNLDLNPERAQGDMYTVNTILQPSPWQFFQQGWYTNDGENHLQRAAGASTITGAQEPVAPCDPRPADVVTAVQAQSFDVLGVYPNPFGELLVFEVHLFEAVDVSVSLFDAGGSEIVSRDFGRLPRGRNIIRLDGIAVPAGLYEAVLRTGDEIVRRSVIKAGR
jgi:alkaline phosphatase D